MESTKNGVEDFVTVVSVGQSKVENFVTVLSIGTKNEELTDRNEAHRDEDVEVYRLPGERLGFGLKFEGGNKTTELVRRLFVQSCADQSPASRAKCSWGSLGEGDEILSIDGVPVTSMSRLDCVRRLKESQLVIKLVVRYQGALKPEVVSAERKSTPEKKKIPPNLPPMPPPVPPRKLRQARGSADGDANPSPAKKVPRNGAVNGLRGGIKSTDFDVFNSPLKGNNIISKTSPKERSDASKHEQEPPEPMVYLDARSQDGSSNHGSTSDDTGSSMSTVVDKSSTSDRFPTSAELVNESSKESFEILESFEHLDHDFCIPQDYLLKRLANSEAVTHVESRGEAGAVVEKVTAVVAPNTVLIEETMTLQPPLSFQDAPLSYGHEAKPEIFYATDLAADSTTHFRPIRDDAFIVDCVNGEKVFEVSKEQSSPTNDSEVNTNGAPPLPSRNHINCIPINQNIIPSSTTNEVHKDEKMADVPALPPKPLPRKDIKLRKKRLPPPPPPTTAPRKEIPPPVPARNLDLSKAKSNCEKVAVYESNEEKADQTLLIIDGAMKNRLNTIELHKEEINGSILDESLTNLRNDLSKSEEEIGERINNNEPLRTNKALEIIEMKKVKACNESLNKIEANEKEIMSVSPVETLNYYNSGETENIVVAPVVPAPRKIIKPSPEVNKELKESDSIDVWEDAEECKIEESPILESQVDEIENQIVEVPQAHELSTRIITSAVNSQENEEINSSSDSEDNDDDHYWQNNLATIGEEEEATSMEYASVNNVANGTKNLEPAKALTTVSSIVSEDDQINRGRDDTQIVMQKESNEKQDKSAVNGRMMDNCGGGQRLPPDGDEFPAAYQEFSASAQQYQYVSTPRNIGTMTSNGTVMVDGTYESKKTAQSTDQRVPGQHITSSIEETTIKTSEIVNVPDSQRVTFTNTYSARDKRHNMPGVVLSEHKIEIAGYYPKESKIEPKVIETVVADGGSGKDYPDSQPPPLPLTGPPKMEKPVRLGKSSSTDNTPRKFSLNGDLRRQDDKSEKSVRDKIAMFSSQNCLESPLFPNNSITTAVTTSKRLSKYKSSEDFFGDDHHHHHHHMRETSKDRTLSSFDLTDSGKNHNIDSQSFGKYRERLPSLPAMPPPEELINRTLVYTKGSSTSINTQKSTSLTTSASFSDVKSVLDRSKLISPLLNLSQQDISKSSTNLTRATSFSGGIPYNNEPVTNTNGQISRANSLASTFRKTNEDMRRTSLNQLIEQRKKGISKLRGLVIPEKVDIVIDQPIMDLPEIKSRDSILIQQKASIQDKWGSQSSLASNTSTQSMPIRTTTFKMPAPQILPKYSPAFKRKTLAVYATTNSTSEKPASPSTLQTNPMLTGIPTEPPKSLESICSPTRSDYSFEYVSSVSPEGQRTRPRPGQRKTRGEYDDSDNDSAVSSSQSSISRGFSPPSSPVPSERSNLSSERSYQMIMEIPRNYLPTERSHFSKTASYPADRSCSESIRSSSGSSSGSGSTPRSPLSEHNSRCSGIPQSQLLKRSSSTETNCSNSSTLTSGSHTSAESLSRRVLKPQSVEAINRKNILASARCRSGRDLNGSPLIQRKFSDDEDTPHTPGNMNYQQTREINGNGGITIPNVKIAYVDMIEDYEETNETKDSEPQSEISIPMIVDESQLNEGIVQSSDDLKNWVQLEARALLVEKPNIRNAKPTRLPQVPPQTKIPGIKTSLNLNEANVTTPSPKRDPSIELINNNKTKIIDTHDDDLITTLTTKSRCRAPINLEDNTVFRSKSQMSLEDILAGKSEPKPMPRSESQLISSDSHGKLPAEFKDTTKSIMNDSSFEDKLFVSKIPTYSVSKTDVIDELSGPGERTRISKIPMQRSLSRRSTSVTDMKKALEKPEYSTGGNQQVRIAHQRFPSLDSSVEDSIRPVGSDMDQDRFHGEQFGSISSLASSTSLISQQELAQLVEEASLEEARNSHDVVVVLFHKENPNGNVGITLAGGIDCEAKEITVHRVLSHSIADKDGRIQRGDRILSINGRSTRGLSHRESLTVLKQPRSEVVLVVSRTRMEDGIKLQSRTESVETIVEGSEAAGIEDTAWGPPTRIIMLKDGAGLGFSLEGGRDSPFGDRPLAIKKIFTGGAAEKTGGLTAGDQLLEVNGSDVTRMSRIEAWSFMKKLQDGEVSLLVRHPATKSS